MAIIYVHINKSNNKKYVGISSSTDPKLRWGKEGIGYQGSLFYEKGISQFGWEGFYHIVLNDDINLDTAEQLESRIIKELKLTDIEYGYNDFPGKIIKPNPSLDSLAKTLITKINKYSQQRLDNTPIEQLIDTDYLYNVNTPSIGYIYDLWNKGRINTKLNCQRGYVWTEERQQGMWDTLLFGHRVPEFHAIVNGYNYEIVDGKQRITTIMDIISNKISCKKGKANQKLYPLFDYLKCKEFYFKDLPEVFKQRILNTKVSIAEYSNVSQEDMIILFKKLNASVSLSNFLKGIASNLHMRLNFTRAFEEDKIIKKIFTEKDILASEDEQALVRLAVLLKYQDYMDLKPESLYKYYQDFTSMDLSKSVKIIKNYLEQIEKYLPLLKGFKCMKSYFPIFSYLIIKEKLTGAEIEKLFNYLKSFNGTGHGKDLSKATVKERYKTLLNFIGRE